LIILVLALVACAGKSSSDSTDGSAAADQDRTLDTANGNGEPAAAGPSPMDLTLTAEPLAAMVNGDSITLTAFERERARRAYGMTVEPATAAAFDAVVLQSLIDQLLIAQAAAREGLVVTDAEIDAELAVQSELAAANGQTLEEIVEMQLYSMDEYRDAQRQMLLAQKTSQVVINVSPFAAQVHSRHILVADEATARDLLVQLDQGADFAALAAEYSLDGSTAPTGGDLDWVSRGDLLQPEVEDVVFSLQPGQRTTEPVRSSLGYHIIEVLDRVEDRPLSQAALAQKKQAAFMAWLENERANAVIVRYVATGS
jgi:parvulin-like peptidyl-prolyl isomerase